MFSSITRYIKNKFLHRRSLSLGDGSLTKALYNSIAYDITDISEYLLTEQKEKIKINEPIHDGYSAIASAVRHSSAKTISLILAFNDFDPSSPHNAFCFRQPVLFQVVRNTRYNKVEILSLLRPIYCFDQKDKNGATLLTYCAANGLKEEIKYLIECGSDPLSEWNSAATNYYYTDNCPLYCALVYNPNTDVFSFMIELIKQRTTFSEVDLYGRLLCAVCSSLQDIDFERFLNIIKLLLDSGAPPEYFDSAPLISNENTPLESLRSFTLSISEMGQVLNIFESTVDINGPCERKGNYILQLLENNCVQKKHELIRLLYRYGADFNTIYTFSNLRLSLESYEPLWFKILNDEVRHPKWDVPSAKQYQLIDICSALFDSGALINSKDSYGSYYTQTLPLKLTKQAKLEIANLLREFGMCDEAISYIE